MLTLLSPFLRISHRHLAVHQQREQGRAQAGKGLHLKSVGYIVNYQSCNDDYLIKPIMATMIATIIEITEITIALLDKRLVSFASYKLAAVM